MINRVSAILVLTLLVAMAAVAWGDKRASGTKGHDNATPPARAHEKAAEARIWALEHAYWVSNRDAKHEQIVSAWHDQFLGWPEGEQKPIDKKQGARFVREKYAKPSAFSFEIEPVGIRIVGNVAVNHYWLHRASKNDAAKPQMRPMRITHTWIQDGSGWRMLGGMSDTP